MKHLLGLLLGLLCVNLGDNLLVEHRIDVFFGFEVGQFKVSDVLPRFGYFCFQLLRTFGQLLDVSVKHLACVLALLIELVFA